MSPESHDPLLDRVRAADPLAGRTLRTDLDRDRAEGARRRQRARRVRRASAGGGLLALAATLALALAPGEGPRGVSPLVRAVQAAELPSHSIVALESVYTSRDLDHPDRDIAQHYETWLRTAAGGRLLAFRQRDLKGFRAENVGSHLVSKHFTSGAILVGGVVHKLQTSLPSTAFALEVRALLAAAHADPQHHRVTIRAASSGRTAIHIVDHAGGTTAHTVRVRDLLVDSTTYAPIQLRDFGYQYFHGRTYRQVDTERIVRERVLPDTPQNRRFLRLGGPTR